ncbi:MAG: MobA/MobL family protein, partial [Oscillibacter sp.]|nr:MobA/MobL family protein [Oscillibacter sp.]
MTPIAIFHCPIQIIKRSRGRSAVEAAAYRSGEKLTNEWDGRTHDYTRKGGIVHTEIILPANAPRDFYDRAILWNSVEMSEKAANAQLAREVEVALPNELNREEQLKLVREFVKDAFVDAGMCADIAVHDKGDGNPHAHIMLTLRPLNPDGTWGAKCRKVYEVDADGNRIPDGKGGWKNHRENTTDWNDKGNAEKWRASWASHLNKALELKRVAARVDHRSYKRQGVDKIPSIHMGVAAMRMEKRGIRTIKGDFNRAIAADNKLLKELKARITRLYNWSKELAAREKSLGGRKQSVMAQLMDAQFARQKEKSANSNYAAIRRLKENAAVFNFLMEHNINSVEELFDVISDLNDRYYDLRGKIVNAERRIAALRERLDKLKQYRSYKAVRQKLDTLNGKKRAL